jgi:vancomycin resistance protein VanJ
MLAAAAALAMSGGAALLAGLGGCGQRSGWLDVINSFVPLLFALAVAGGGLAFLSPDAGWTRTATLALAGSAAIYGLVRMGPEFARWRLWAPVGQGEFRILSANVWALNPDSAQAVTDLLACDPDAILLQEADGAILPELHKLKAQYPYASDCAASVQIWLKSPILAQGGTRSRRYRTTPALVWVSTTAPDGRPLTLATVHFSWPFPPRFQEANRVTLAAEINRFSDGDVVLAGDFNTTPWSFAMRHQDGALKPLKRRTFACFSWPARLHALRLPWPLPILPLDHLYAGSNWETVKVTRRRITGSDHLAIEVVLSRRP